MDYSQLSDFEINVAVFEAIQTDRRITKKVRMAIWCLSHLRETL